MRFAASKNRTLSSKEHLAQPGRFVMITSYLMIREAAG